MGGPVSRGVQIGDLEDSPVHDSGASPETTGEGDKSLWFRRIPGVTGVVSIGDDGPSFSIELQCPFHRHEEGWGGQ